MLLKIYQLILLLDIILLDIELVMTVTFRSVSFSVQMKLCFTICKGFWVCSDQLTSFYNAVPLQSGSFITILNRSTDPFRSIVCNQISWRDLKNETTSFRSITKNGELIGGDIIRKHVVPLSIEINVGLT